MKLVYEYLLYQKNVLYRYKLCSIFVNNLILYLLLENCKLDTLKRKFIQFGSTTLCVPIEEYIY